jgi:hypothetical protein
MLSAGGFPGSDFNTGKASCVISNTGIRDVVVDWNMYDGPFGTVLAQEAGRIVHPGQTFFSSVSFANFSWPSACTFDVSTKTGVRASFVYENGSTVVVIPAQK